VDKRRTSRKKSILAISQASIEELAKKTNEEREKDDPTLKKEAPIVREELQFKIINMEYLERLETEEEVRRRREEEERKAALEKTKKKALPKGQTDPAEEPQTLRIAIENPMDMGHLQPTYSKWLTSQLQFIKDRNIRDSDSKEQPWERIYP